MFSLSFTWCVQGSKLVLMDIWNIPAVVLWGSLIGHISIIASLLLFSSPVYVAFSLPRAAFTTFQIFNQCKYFMKKDFHLWGNHKTTIQRRLTCVIMDSCERSWVTEGGEVSDWDWKRTKYLLTYRNSCSESLWERFYHLPRWHTLLWFLFRRCF